MSTVIEGLLQGSGKRFGIVVSRFNELISRKLLEGAMDCLLRHGTEKENISVVWVPGSFEIPVTTKKLISTGSFDAIICLGAVVRGDTPHFNYVASEVTKGVAACSLESSMPVSLGVLTTDTMEQAIDRAGMKNGNKGFDAALSAIEMADLFQSIK